ncbi:hypothetical protein AVEN_109453-1, partial [Araneus ventricosus]
GATWLMTAFWDDTVAIAGEAISPLPMPNGPAARTGAPRPTGAMREA